MDVVKSRTNLRIAQVGDIVRTNTGHVGRIMEIDGRRVKVAVEMKSGNAHAIMWFDKLTNKMI